MVTQVREVGGSCCVERVRDQHHCGGEINTTNNRMEPQAAIEGLRLLNDDSDVLLVTDSQYVRKGITEWIVNWKRNGWRTAAKKTG